MGYHLRGLMQSVPKYINLLTKTLPMGPLQGISDTEIAAEAAKKYREKITKKSVFSIAVCTNVLECLNSLFV